MKIIGFADYYINEWHAIHYPEWIKEASEELGQEYVVKYVWAEKEVAPVSGVSTAQWCQTYGAEQCDSLAELCEKCDHVILLAPSNPEKHLKYAREILKYGKRTYIDKTFAATYEEAKEIFRIAKSYGTEFFTTSALRYAEELSDVEGANQLLITGGGGNLEEYIIHQLEMAVKLMGQNAVSVKVDSQGHQAVCRIGFEGGKTASLIYSPSLPFTVCAEKNDGQFVYRELTSDYFRKLMKEILLFFETGVKPFEEEQTLAVMKIRDQILTM